MLLKSVFLFCFYHVSAIYREHKFEKTLQIDSKSWGFRKNLTADDIKTPDYIIEHLIKAIR